MMPTALDAGMKVFDNSWDYNAGESERREGRALRDGYRDKAFLKTKLDGRTKTAAAKHLEESLQCSKQTASASCKSMSSFGWTTRNASSRMVAQSNRSSLHAMLANCVTSASRATRVPNSPAHARDRGASRFRLDAVQLPIYAMYALCEIRR